MILLSIGAASCAAAPLPAEEAGALSPANDTDATRDPTARVEPVAATLEERGDAGDGKPREPSVTAVVGYERILQKPDTKAPLIGLIRAGQSVPLASPERLTGPGVSHCNGGFYAVKPRGYVCVGRNSTLDAEDPRALAAAEVLPDAQKPLPYRVGVMMVGSPQYGRIPTPQQQRDKEPDLEQWLKRVQNGNLPEGSGAPESTKAGRGPSPRITKYIEVVKPPLMAEDDAYEGRKMSFAGEFDAEGRTFLVTPDLTFVPKDKVRFVTSPRLAGVDLKKGSLKFPIGYTWIEDAAKLKKTFDGKFLETGEVWPRQTFIQIEGPLVMGKGGPYWKTSEGLYIRNDQITQFKSRTGRPAGVKANDKWIDVRITWGTLIAYEGDTPVYATAISPGQDGITASSTGHHTARGLHSVGWKLYSADMSGFEKKKPWAVDEVPFVAYYKDSYALHAAWWHDDFGRPKSHGCVNIAPTDAVWLWNWMEPGMPKGWYAVAAFYPEVKGTAIMLRP